MKNEIISFKGRVFNKNKPIDVYRNLNRKGKVYSVRQEGVVVGHATAICISNVEFVVNKSGKERAMKTKTRNVHAFIRGFYTEMPNKKSKDENRVFYSPFAAIGFHKIENKRKKEIKNALRIIINEEGVKTL